ncbi:hypothetical protein BGZ94_002085 [Podila epigama]|nr:hypothetical protein BGZ94_002085 [Podila epigama]
MVQPNPLQSPLLVANAISCKEIVQFCQTRFGLTISLSTASRLRSSATERLSTDLLNPSAKRHRSVKFPEFEKALVQELKALEQEQLQIQQEQERLLVEGRANGANAGALSGRENLPPVMQLTSEAAITQVAKGIAERMGITESELGLTSGWYHGFRKRHGIKHRQLKQRANVPPTSGVSLYTGQLNPPSLSGDNFSTSRVGAKSGNGSEGADGSDGGDGDEEMEDVSQDTKEGISKAPRLDSVNSDMSLGLLSGTQPASQDNSAGQKREVKRVTAASGNDALDVISEYLLQNGDLGATKLPLVTELRKFLMAQTELENASLVNRASTPTGTITSSSPTGTATSAFPTGDATTTSIACVGAGTSAPNVATMAASTAGGHDTIISDNATGSMLIGNLPILESALGSTDARSAVANTNETLASSNVLANIPTSSSTIVTMDDIINSSSGNNNSNNSSGNNNTNNDSNSSNSNSNNIENSNDGSNDGSNDNRNNDQ